MLAYRKPRRSPFSSRGKAFDILVSDYSGNRVSDSEFLYSSAIDMMIKNITCMLFWTTMIEQINEENYRASDASISYGETDQKVRNWEKCGTFWLADCDRVSVRIVFLGIIFRSGESLLLFQ